MKKYIRIDVLYIVAILDFFVMFVNLNYIPDYRTIRDLFMALIGMYILTQVPKIDFFRDNLFLWSAIGFTALLCLYTSYTQRYNYANINIFYSSIEFTVSLIETFILMGMIASRGLLDDILKKYENLLCGLLAINDLLVFAVGPREKIYFLGSKFVVVYVHLFFLCIHLYNKRKEEVKLLEAAGFCIFMVIISLKVSCATGIVGTGVFWIFYLFLSKYKEIFENPRVYTVILLLCGSFVVTYALILNSELIQNLIVGLLGRSLTLTGRVNIYVLIPFILLPKLWLGYGYASTYTVYMFYTGYANSQNGLIEWVSEIGIIGTLGLVAIFIYAIGYSYKTKSNRESVYPIITYIYVLTFISTIEVSINKMFISAIAIIWASALEKRRINEKNM